MARQIFQKTKKLRDKVLDKTSTFIADNFMGARGARQDADFYNKVAEDVKVLREVRAGDRKNNSKTIFETDEKTMRDPDSLMRRKMRVDTYKQEQKTGKRLFPRSARY